MNESGYHMSSFELISVFELSREMVASGLGASFRTRADEILPYSNDPAAVALDENSEMQSDITCGGYATSHSLRNVAPMGKGLYVFRVAH